MGARPSLDLNPHLQILGKDQWELRYTHMSLTLQGQAPEKSFINYLQR